MIPFVGPGTSEAVTRRIPGPATGVVVARPRLFSRLSGPARVAVVSAPRNLYATLGTHRRTEAVARARALGLLAPSGLIAAGR